MYQVIARKYRPATFQELVSQEHVRTTLENAIRQRRIAHGYILSGQRGTGKTTVARIIARCLNCVQGPTPEPCGECSSCREIAAGSSVDVIEIDAASNRGINEMRELRENVRYRPARDRYKVFIIDEAHQITSEAFNALLKTLEEPPEWVVFILCTTEAHKIPTTIASRCQQFSFRSVDFAELIERMRWICEQEGIQADEESLAVLAQAGEGSVRDSLSALDQAIACCGVTLRAPELRALLGRFSVEALEQVASALLAGDSSRMLDVVDELDRNGQNLQHFCRELARYFRNLLVARISGKQTRLIAASEAEQERLRGTSASFSEDDLTRYLQIALDLYKDLQASLQPKLHMEMGLLKLVYAGRLQAIEEAIAQLPGGAAPNPPAMETPRNTPVRGALPASPPPRTGPSPFERDKARKLAPPAGPPDPQARGQQTAAATARAPEPSVSEPSGDLKSALLTALNDLGLTMTADGIEHSEVTEAGGAVVITAPEMYRILSMQQGEIRRGLQKAIGRQPALKVTISDNVSVQAPAAPVAKDDVTERALAHPEVKRFQELFPDAEVRTVRNLKE